MFDRISPQDQLRSRLGRAEANALIDSLMVALLVWFDDDLDRAQGRCAALVRKALMGQNPARFLETCARNTRRNMAMVRARERINAKRHARDAR